MRSFVLAAIVAGCLAMPSRADSDAPEDTRLKGRGFGRLIAGGWNGADRTTRRVIIYGGAIFLVGAMAFGIRHFVRETRELSAPRAKEPWEV